MRIAVNHVTRYRFEEKQDRIIQALRMRPQDTDSQTVVAWRFDVDCDARLKRHEDGFGNEVTMVYIDGPVDAVDVVVTGEVLTDRADEAAVSGAPEPLPPELFLRTSPRTMASQAMKQFAADTIGEGEVDLAKLRDLNSAICSRLTHQPAKPDDIRPAAEAFEAGEATVREMAAILVGIARSLGLPARFVSGYRAANEDQPSNGLHAWTEIFLEGRGWIGFDPAHGTSPDQCYIRVASGVDDSDTRPVSGSREGAGDETLDVEILVGAASN